MRPIKNFWFTANDKLVGIVVGKDTYTGKKKAYIGLGFGENEDEDAKHILDYGVPFPIEMVDMLKEALTKEKKK